MKFLPRPCILTLSLCLLAAAVIPGAAQPRSARPSRSPVTAQVGYEVRAVWLTTLMGLDWPRQAARTAEEEAAQRQSLTDMLDRLRQVGINTVFFQARLRATTAYPSAIEPWDGVFAGKAGRTPGYDPLAFALEECHRRGMELHAWVVAFPIGKADAMRRLGRAGLAQRHPELCRRCGDQWMMDPGVPGTAGYLAGLCREIVEHYDVDGIHLDYIRYPEPSIPFDDDAAYRRYGHGQNRADWRRDNVTRCVRAIHDAVKGVRPWIKMSCSPVGKYADLTRYSSMGWNARDAVSQPAQQWLADGLMDMLCPMMYFDGLHYYPFLADWREADAGRIVAPGLGIYFLSPQEKDWPLQVVMRQMNVARSEGLGGLAFFRARYLLDNVKGIYDLLRYDTFRRPALVPPMVWADSIPPARPVVTQRVDGQTLYLSWPAVADETPVTYNVYRLDDRYGDVLLARRLRTTAFTRLLALPALKYSRYVVTAVDAYGNESR